MQETLTWKERLKALNCVVVIPTYNNNGTILKVISDVRGYADDILVVNDGSTDNTHELLEGVEGIEKLEYKKNRGKGGALKLAIKWAAKQGYDYMLTIDADGQHFADDIPVFIKAAEEEPGTLFVGARNLKAKNMPGANTFANKFSNFWFRVDTGKKMCDTQSGYRLYPLEKLKKKHFITGRYEFEVEIMVRAAWNRIPVKNIPIKVYYAPKEERVSHFKPLRDFGRISLLNTGLFFWAILIHYPWIGLTYFTRGDVEELKHFFETSKDKTFMMAASMGWGVFCGIIPAWGYQTLIAGTSAYALRLNKIVSMGFSTVGIPPLIPLIVYLSSLTGAWVTSKPCLITFNDLSGIGVKQFMIKFAYALPQYILGAFVLAAISGIVTLFLGWLTLIIVNAVRNRKVSQKEDI